MGRQKQAISVQNGKFCDWPKRFSESIQGVTKLLMNQKDILEKMRYSKN